MTATAKSHTYSHKGSSFEHTDMPQEVRIAVRETTRLLDLESPPSNKPFFYSTDECADDEEEEKYVYKIDRVVHVFPQPKKKKRPRTSTSKNPKQYLYQPFSSYGTLCSPAAREDDLQHLPPSGRKTPRHAKRPILLQHLLEKERCTRIM